MLSFTRPQGKSLRGKKHHNDFVAEILLCFLLFFVFFTSVGRLVSRFYWRQSRFCFKFAGFHHSVDVGLWQPGRRR